METVGILDAKTTAVIVVDMWNRHYCKTYSKWSKGLVPRLNTALSRFRRAGIPIVFMSGDVFMQSHVHELGAILLKHYVLEYGAIGKIGVAPLPEFVPVWTLHCACPSSEAKCVANKVWSRIDPGVHRWMFDLCGDWNMHVGFLRMLGIKTVLYCGGAANICVLSGRSFAVWQTRAYGFDTILLRDLVIPYLPMPRLEAMALIEEYYERYVCPVYSSGQIRLVGRGNWPDSIIDNLHLEV